MRKHPGDPIPYIGAYAPYMDLSLNIIFYYKRCLMTGDLWNSKMVIDIRLLIKLILYIHTFYISYPCLGLTIPYLKELYVLLVPLLKRRIN